MATLDFIYDLKEKLDEQNMEYVLLVVQHGSKESNVNAFYSVETDSSSDMLCAASRHICTSLEADELGTDLQILSIEEEEEHQRGEDDLNNEYKDKKEDEDEDEDEDEKH